MDPEFEAWSVVAFKTLSNLGQEAGVQSGNGFQEISLCLDLSSISHTSLIESCESVIKNSIPQVLLQNQIIRISSEGSKIYLKKKKKKDQNSKSLLSR